MLFTYNNHNNNNYSYFELICDWKYVHKTLQIYTCALEKKKINAVFFFQLSLLHGNYI